VAVVPYGGALRDRALRAGKLAWSAFVALWIVATFYSTVEAPHLWTNYASVLTWIAPLVFVAATAVWPFTSGVRSFAVSSIAIAALMAIVGQALFPNMVPSRGDMVNSLTIGNASSTPLTLKVMLAIAQAGMPFVVGYTIWIYRKFMGVVVLDEHSY
jgi:cytochrome d ubiquinol oxidase subunit II